MTAAPRPPFRRTARLAASLACAVAMTLGAAGSASADAWSHTDPAGDVASFTTEEEGATPVPGTAPTRERGDVRKVRMAHHAHRVVVRFAMRKGMTEYGLFYRIRTPKAEYALERFRIDGYRGVLLTKNGGDRPLRCAGINWDIDHRAATVAMSIPRSCLGQPRWVRVGAGVATFTENVAYWDDALFEGDRRTMPLSPRLYRA